MRILNDSFGPWRSFESALEGAGLAPLTATRITVLQINVGKLCNQVCHHCHVDAGPDRKETMNREVAELCMRALETTDIPTVDITGGAPELNPNFRRLVTGARASGRHVIARTNLTVFFEDAQRDLPEFYSEHEVEVTASLPAYTEDEHDRVRGRGAFMKSIIALKRLHSLGYGEPGGGVLNLVHNPSDDYLAPPQAALEAEYRRELMSRHGIAFNSLYAFTNVPIGRFRERLLRAGQLDNYMGTLSWAFNPSAIGGLMCRRTISVGWDGTLHDCDFNLALGIGLEGDSGRSIRDPDALIGRRINVGEHCYACTAGQGST